MQRIQPTTYVAFLCLVFCSSVAAEEREPTLITPAGMRMRRDAIYEELDRNVESVKQCFELLDVTPKSDAGACEFLDGQIQQYDDRSNVLHEELEEIERQEFLSQRHSEMLRDIQRLQSEAQQLKKHGHVVQAQLRAAKASAMQKTLDDGTWKLLAGEDWSCEAKGMDLVSVLQLNVEVENLKIETQALREEVKQLREAMRRLEEQVKSANAEK